MGTARPALAPPQRAAARPYASFISKYKFPANTTRINFLGWPWRGKFGNALARQVWERPRAASPGAPWSGSARRVYLLMRATSWRNRAHILAVARMPSGPPGKGRGDSRSRRTQTHNAYTDLPHMEKGGREKLNMTNTYIYIYMRERSGAADVGTPWRGKTRRARLRTGPTSLRS